MVSNFTVHPLSKKAQTSVMDDPAQSDNRESLDLRDTHMCFICTVCIIGIDNYVRHKKNYCLLPVPMISSKKAVECLIAIVGTFTSYSCNLERNNVADRISEVCLGRSVTRVSKIIREVVVNDTPSVKENSLLDNVNKTSTQQSIQASYNSVSYSQTAGKESPDYTFAGNRRKVVNDNPLTLRSSSRGLMEKTVKDSPLPECNVCQRSFNTTLSYERHLATGLHLRKSRGFDESEQNASRKRKCFLSKKAVENLEAKNSKLQKLQCPKCRFLNFQSSFALAKHVLAQHKEEIKFGLFPKTLLNRCFKGITPHLPLSCFSCRFFCNRSEDLLSHLSAVVHEDVCSAPFKCKYCSFSTTDVEHAKKHLKSLIHEDKIVSKEKESRFLKVLDSLGLEKSSEKVRGHLFSNMEVDRRQEIGGVQVTPLNSPQREGILPNQKISRSSVEASSRSILGKCSIVQIDQHSSMKIEESQMQKDDADLHEPSSLEKDKMLRQGFEENDSSNLEKDEDSSRTVEENFSSSLEEKEGNRFGRRLHESNRLCSPLAVDGPRKDRHPLNEESCGRPGFLPTDLKEDENTSYSCVDTLTHLELEDSSSNLKVRDGQRVCVPVGHQIRLKDDENSRHVCKTSSLNLQKELSSVTNKRVQHCSRNSSLKMSESHQFNVKISEHSIHIPENSSLNVKREGNSSSEKVDESSLRSLKNSSFSMEHEGNSSSEQVDESSLRSRQNSFLNVEQENNSSSEKVDESNLRSSKNSSFNVKYEDCSSSEKLEESGLPSSKNSFFSVEQEDNFLSKEADEPSLHNSKDSFLNIGKENSLSRVKGDNDIQHNLENIPFKAELKGDSGVKDEDSRHSFESSNSSQKIISLRTKGDECGMSSSNISVFNLHRERNPSLNDEDSGNVFEIVNEGDDIQHNFKNSSFNVELERNSCLKDEDSRHSFGNSNFPQKMVFLRTNGGECSYDNPTFNLQQDGKPSLNDEDSQNISENVSQITTTSCMKGNEESRQCSRNTSLNSEQKKYSSNSKGNEDYSTGWRRDINVSNSNTSLKWAKELGISSSKKEDSCHSSEEDDSSSLEEVSFENEPFYITSDKEDGERYSFRSVRIQDSSSDEDDSDGSSFHFSDFSGFDESDVSLFDEDHSASKRKVTLNQDIQPILESGSSSSTSRDLSTFEGDGLLSSGKEDDNKENEGNLEADKQLNVNYTEKPTSVGEEKSSRDNYCDTCNKTLGTKYTYAKHKLSSRHMRRLSDPQYPCSKRKWVPSKKYLEVMKVPRWRSYLCPKCFGKTFKTRYAWAKHVLMYHKEDIVGGTFERDTLDKCWVALNQHLPFSCTTCKFFTNTSDDLLTHARHRYHPVATLGWFHCHFCFYRTKYVEELHRHFLKKNHCNRENGDEVVVVLDGRKKKKLSTQE